MGDRIPPTRTTYTPETARSTPDRNPDGAAIVPPRHEKRKKKKQKKRPKENPRDREDGHVDIRASQIETPLAMNPAASSTPPAPR